MFVPQLILARALHISASILITGTFTFDLVMLGLTGPSESDHLREIERSNPCAVHDALWSPSGF
jgi:hypothetical protein